MKKFLLLSILAVSFSMIYSHPAFAYRKGSHPSSSGEYSQDHYGHWTRRDNLWNDQDSDGVPNYSDRNDEKPYDPNIYFEGTNIAQTMKPARCDPRSGSIDLPEECFE